MGEKVDSKSEAPAPAPTTEPPPPPLEPQTPEETVKSLTLLLQQIGDLSAYIDMVRDDGTVVINTFPIRGQPECTTLPRATILNDAISNKRLERVERALESLNQWRAKDLPLPIDTVFAACLHPDETRSDIRSREVDSADEPAE